MPKLNKSVIPIIESVYESLTPSEKIAADFFIQNVDEEIDFSASKVAKEIHISEASLTRFAKKCGYSGYREFIAFYKLNIADSSNSHTQITKKVLADYEEILNKSYSLINEDQIEKIVQYMIEADRVYFYGIGSSGLVTQELKSRFMRLGLICDAFTDPDLIKINSSLLDENSVLIALSISSETPVILNSLRQAKENKAKTILFTANIKEEVNDEVDEVVSIATRKNLSFGNRISPQFPLLVMIDVVYNYFLKSDFDSKRKIFTSTLTALEENREKDGD